MTFIYKSEPRRGTIWQAQFAEQAPGIGFRQWPDAGDLDDVRYLAAWEPSAELIASLPNLEVLFSVGAGVDQFDLSAIPQHIKIVRMVEPRLTQGMAEYAVLATLALHRNLIDYVAAQRERRWAPIDLVPAEERRVGVMGLGEMGMAAIESLRPFDFQLAGWSRSGRAIEGFESFAGTAALGDFLSRCDILICLLPLTNDTRGILCRRHLSLLPRGAGLVNAARGAHVVEADLIEALDSGQVGGAVLDVLAEEPPPADHPFWNHPRVLITPHMASNTDSATGGRAVLDNVLRHERSEAMHGEICRKRGY